MNTTRKTSADESTVRVRRPCAVHNASACEMLSAATKCSWWCPPMSGRTRLTLSIVRSVMGNSLWFIGSTMRVSTTQRSSLSARSLESLWMSTKCTSWTNMSANVREARLVNSLIFASILSFTGSRRRRTSRAKMALETGVSRSMTRL